MRFVAPLALVFSPLIASGAIAAPPPPARYPPNLPQSVGGYDLPPLYSVYENWVSRGRKAALDLAIHFEPGWHAKHYWGAVAESELIHYDFGMLRKDRLERYCSGDWMKSEPAGDCEYRYRYAFVPGELYADEKREKLIIESFRPDVLAARLAKAGWKASDHQNFWSDQLLQKIFEEHTDLAAFYRPLVEFHESSSATCKGFRESLAGLVTVSLNLDPRGRRYEGPDFPIHGQQTLIKLTATTAAGGRVTLDGADALYPTMKPIWDAVEACAK